MLRSPAVLVLALALVAGCGGKHHDASTAPGASTTGTSTPTPTTPVITAPPIALATSGANPGLPSDFPTGTIPLVAGAVALPVGQGTGGAGKKGWVLELRLAKATGACFDAAAAALTAHGFVKAPGETRSGGQHEAQFLAPGYAVIVSTSRTDDGKCRLGYEVGQLGG